MPAVPTKRIRSGRTRAMAPAAPTAASIAPIPTGWSTSFLWPRTRRRRGASSGSKAETISVVPATSGPHRLKQPDALLDRRVRRQQVHEGRGSSAQRVHDEKVRGGRAGELVRANLLRLLEPQQSASQVLGVTAQG